MSSVQRLPECCSHFDRHTEDSFTGMSGKHTEYLNVSGCVIPGKVAKEGTVVLSGRPLSRSASIFAVGSRCMTLTLAKPLGLTTERFLEEHQPGDTLFFPTVPPPPSSRGKGCCRTHRDGGSCWRQSRRTCGTLWRAGGRSVLARGLVGQSYNRLCGGCHRHRLSARRKSAPVYIAAATSRSLLVVTVASVDVSVPTMLQSQLILSTSFSPRCSSLVCTLRTLLCGFAAFATSDRSTPVRLGLLCSLLLHEAFLLRVFVQ